MLTPCELKKCIYLYPQQNEIEANDFLNMFKTVARKLQIRCSDNRYDITFFFHIEQTIINGKNDIN